MKNYLRFTHLVDTDESIKSITDTFGDNPYEIIVKTLSWMRSNIAPMEDSMKNEVWRKRKASEVFSSKKASGCTDKAILFLSFLRTANIPCSYVESISNHTLTAFKNQNYKGNFEGHVFVKVYLEGMTLLVDPTKHQIYLKNELPITTYASNNIVIGEGLDFNDIGTDTQEKLDELVRKLITNKSL